MTQISRLDYLDCLIGEVAVDRGDKTSEGTKDEAVRRHRGKGDPFTALDGVECVYAIGNNDEGPIKFGYTADLRTRLFSLIGGSPLKVGLLGVIPGGERTEKLIHMCLSQDRMHGEWFKRSPRVLALTALMARLDYEGVMDLLEAIVDEAA